MWNSYHISRVRYQVTNFVRYMELRFHHFLGLETFSQLVYEDQYGAVSEGSHDCF